MLHDRNELVKIMSNMYKIRSRRIMLKRHSHNVHTPTHSHWYGHKIRTAGNKRESVFLSFRFIVYWTSATIATISFNSETSKTHTHTAFAASSSITMGRHIPTKRLFLAKKMWEIKTHLPNLSELSLVSEEIHTNNQRRSMNFSND